MQKYNEKCAPMQKAWRKDDDFLTQEATKILLSMTPKLGIYKFYERKTGHHFYTKDHFSHNPYQIRLV